jgi:hypothetical protein
MALHEKSRLAASGKYASSKAASRIGTRGWKTCQ